MMSEGISTDDLMRYLDGEMEPDERARVETELARSTELQREMAIFRALKSDFREMSFHPAAHRRSVWDEVNVRVTRPLGWVFLTVGAAIWTAYGVYVFATSPADPWEKLATGAVAIGILMLLASVIVERYREAATDPYRDVYR